MKLDLKIILGAIGFGAGVWIIDALLDYYLFYTGSFWDLLIINTPSHEIYIRITILIFFILFGIITSILVSKEKLAKENLTVTLNSMGDAFIATDKSGNITGMNPIAQELTGWSIEDARNKPIDRIFNIINSKTRDKVENPVYRVIREGIIVGLANHTSLIAKDGTERQIADSGAPIMTENGQMQGVVLIFRDVTREYKVQEALVQSERFLQGVFESIQDGLIVLNTDFTIRFTNKTMRTWHPDRLPMEGKICHQCFNHLDTPCQDCPSIRCLKSLKTERQEIKKPEGSKIEWIELFSYPLINPKNNEIEAIVEFIRDITEQKKSSQQIEHLNRVLKGIRNVNQLITVERDRQKLIEQACVELVKTQGYSASWVLLLNEELEYQAFAKSGKDYHLNEILKDTNTIKNCNCIKQCYHSKNVFVRQRPDEYCKKCLITKNGPDDFVMQVRLEHANNVYGIMTVMYSPELQIDQEEQELYIEVANDIALALYNIEISEKRDKAVLELQISEERFRNVIQSSPMGTFIYQLDENEQLIFTDSNPAADKILGIDTRQFIGKTIQQAFPPLAETKVPERYKEAAQKGVAWYSEQIEYDHNNISGAYEVYAYQTSPGAMAVHFLDITERKIAEKSLKESEERYRLLAETAQDFICIHDLEGKIEYLNKAAKELSGIDSLTERDYNVTEFIPKEQQAEMFKRVQTRKSGDKGLSLYNSVFVSKDGDLLSMEISSSPIVENNEIRRILVVARDNTEKMQFQEALLKSEENYRLLIENQTDLVIKVDAEGHILFASKSYYSMFGKAEPELLGKNFMPLVHKEDQKATKKAMETLYKPPYTCYVEQRAKTKYGWRWLGWSDKAILDENNNVVEIIGVGRDITDRKKAEEELIKTKERYELALEGADLGTWDWFIKSDKVIIDQRWAEIVGYSLEELQPEENTPMWVNLSHPEDRDKSNMLIAQHLKGELERYECEIRLKHKNGQWIWVLDRGKVVEWDEKGEPLRMSGTHLDINANKKMQETLDLVIKGTKHATGDLFFRNLILGLAKALNLEYVYVGKYLKEQSKIITIGACHKQEIIENYEYYIDNTPDSDIIIKGDFINFHNVQQMYPLDQKLKKNKIDSYMGTPLYSNDGTCIGILVVMDTKRIQDTKRAKTIMSAFADRASAELERSLAEQALRESEEKYRLLVENQTDFVTKVDTTGSFLFVSPSFCELFDKTESELIGTKFLPYIHKDDRIKTAQAMETLNRSPYSCYLEQRYMTKQGMRWLGWSYKSVLENKNVVAIIGIGRDITGRIQAETQLSLSKSRLEALIQSSPSAILVLDSKGMVTLWNPAAERIFGWKSSEVVGNFNPLIPRERLLSFKNRIKNRLYNFETIEELRRPHKDGSLIDVSLSSGPLIDEKNEIVGMIGIFTDITERKRVEKLIKQSLKEKEVLLKEIHHRVKNNMAIITGLLNLQSHSMKNKGELANVFTESVNRIRSMALVHEKLYQSKDFSKIEFREYIESMTNELLKSYDIYNKITVNFDLQDVELDINQAIPCGLILNELVTNSLKHAFPTQETGNLYLYLQLLDNNMLKLTVKDDGVGCDEKKIKKSTTLGIQLVDNLSKQIHGKMEYYCIDGAVFEITFPAFPPTLS